MKSLVCADIVLTFADPASSIETNTLGKVVYDIKTAQAGLNHILKVLLC
jgi:chromosome partitioning protein